jgi:Acyltransferase family
VPSRERIHYLDWLKVLIVYGILLFHVSLVFSPNGWLVRNHEPSLVLSAFAGFCFPWGIPAMFLIAGADAWFGVRSTPAGTFVWKRVLRLLLPFAAGLVVLSPFQRFVASHNPPPPWTELPAYYVSFFRSIRFEPDPEWIARYWLHLWFLGYLFAISVACLPLLAWMREEGGRRLTRGLVAIADRRGGLLVLALPLFVSQLVLRPFFPAYQDWADVATYTFVFAMGAVFVSDRGFETAVLRDIRWLLAIGVIALLGLAATLTALGERMDALRSAPFHVQTAFALFWTLDVWAWNLAVLYLGIRFLNFPNRVMSYLQESVLPFYVIHHPVVVTLASFVVTWQLGVWPKIGVLVILGYGITVLLYDVGVRRWGPMRTLFGLGPLRRRAGVKVVAGVPA